MYREDFWKVLLLRVVCFFVSYSDIIKDDSICGKQKTQLPAGVIYRSERKIKALIIGHGLSKGCKWKKKTLKERLYLKCCW